MLNEEYSLKKKKKKKKGKEMWLLCDWSDIETKAVFSLLYVQSLCLVQFRSNYNMTFNTPIQVYFYTFISINIIVSLLNYQYNY